MAVKTQGTDLYAIDPDTGALLDVGCVTTIDGIDTSVEQIETTCLNALKRTYVAGLATPGTANFTIQTDPQNPAHVRMHQLKTQGRTLQWAVGWRQEAAIIAGTPPAVPTTEQEDGQYVFVLPEARAWIVFEGHMSSYPFSFGQNAVVQSNIGVQISGEPELVPAVITP